VLGHLEQMRVCCFRQNDMSFYNLDSMRKALQQAQTNSNDAVKVHYYIIVFEFIFNCEFTYLEGVQLVVCTRSRGGIAIV
jgi:hypothetical protein